ncbi:MAG: hypothetical protein JXB47_05990 [Anaerolineae bacterium]|nr:hypothetical protein [Anaerolineae bacterium]
MRENLEICIAPNEDGFGTSGWVVGLAKELARQLAVSTVKVVVATDKRAQFHSDKYSSQITLTALPNEPNSIQVAKAAGAVDIERTIDNHLLRYGQSRGAYIDELARAKVLESADMVIDFGVPQMVRAVYDANLRFKSKKEIVAVTVFDHAWSLSLSRIVLSGVTQREHLNRITAALEDIRNDEALTQEVILFGEPICLLDYHGYWRMTVGHLPVVIPGCLGGPLRTLAYAADPAFEGMYARLAASHEPCPPNAYKQARSYARRLLGIENDEPTLFVSGGGTSVWDRVLDGLFDDYLNNPPNYNVITYNPAGANRLGVALNLENVSLNGAICAIERGTLGKLTFIGRSMGETHHVLFPAFDLILTRAGGGTVNNAIAFRVPLMLVEEPGMWQVEQIRRACLTRHIAQGVTFDEFRENGRACVESNGALVQLDTQAEHMHSIPNHQEIWLANTLMHLMS